MEGMQLKNREDTLEWLKGTQMEYELVEHEAVPTVAEMLEKVKFSTPTLLAKNLFLKNKKKEDSYYLVVAQHDTAVNNDLLAKHFGVAKGNLRNGEADTMLSVLGVKPGSVNLFSIINDSEDKVKLVLDRKVHEAANIGVHPMDNTATVRIGQDVLNYIISFSNHEAEIIDFAELASKTTQEDAKKAEKKKEEEKKSSKGKIDDSH